VGDNFCRVHLGIPLVVPQKSIDTKSKKIAEKCGLLIKKGSLGLNTKRTF